MFTSILLVMTAALTAAPAGEPWKMHVIDDTSIGADGVRLADFDGDGYPDIATGWEEGHSIRVYRNPGPAAAGAPWPRVIVAEVPSPEDAVFADLDGDGAMDIISCSEGQEQKIWIHWAPSDPASYMDHTAWTTVPLPAAEGKMQWMYCLPMQLDGRNGIDLVAGAKNNFAAIGWFESPDDPRDLAAWQWHPLRDAGWVMSLIAQDVDGDGLTDIAYTDRRKAYRSAGWLKNPGPDNPGALRAPWKDHTFGGRKQEVMFLNHGAFSSAGPMEWACTSRGSGIFRFTQDESGAWKQQETPMPLESGTGKGIAIGDINGDRLADMVISCENAEERHGVFWLEQTADGWRPHTIAGLTGTKFDLVELYDFDGDGDLDVLTCEEQEKLGVIWYENPLY